MVYFPNEIINLILSFRENHPTAKIIKPLIKKYNTQYIFTKDELSIYNQFKIRMLKFNEHYFETLKYHKKQLYCMCSMDSVNSVCLEFVMKIPEDETTLFVLTVDKAINQFK